MSENPSERYVEQANRVANKLAAMTESRYVVLIGSVADGTADELSDIDLMVLYDPEPSCEAIAKALSKTSVRKFWLSDHHFHVWHGIDGVKNAVLFTSAARVLGFVDRYPQVSFEEYAELSRYIVRGRLLQGAEEEFRSWSEKCKTIPPEMKSKTIRKQIAGVRFYFREGNIDPLVKRQDWIMVNRTICEGVLSILRVVYLLNDQIMIKPKRTRQELEGLPRKPDDFCGRLEVLFTLKNTDSDARQKSAELEALLSEVEQLVAEDEGLQTA